MDPLASLGAALRETGYRFVTPTPLTHERVLDRGVPARSLRDVFGWSKPFEASILEGRILERMEAAGVLQRDGPRLRSKVRFSTVGPLLLAHSAYPTVEEDAVFLGPDTYRFCSYIDARVQRARSVADVGCGSGAGGLLLAGRADSVQLLDINPRALRFTAANAELNSIAAKVVRSDVLGGLDGSVDLVIANPPYLADDLHRAYRDGGHGLGTALSVRICEEALDRLPRGGRLLLYTATPVVDGAHVLWPSLERRLRSTRHDYRELDPDVFGEELARTQYGAVERIAVVGLDAIKL